MIALRILNKLDDFSALFDTAFSIPRIARVDSTSSSSSARIERDYMIENLAAMQSIGCYDPELEQAMRKSLTGIYQRGWRGVPRRALYWARERFSSSRAQTRTTKS
jgi:hypothetical protein